MINFFNDLNHRFPGNASLETPETFPRFLPPLGGETETGKRGGWK